MKADLKQTNEKSINTFTAMIEPSRSTLSNPSQQVGPSILALTADLCAYRTGVVADDNAPLFERIAQELPIKLHRYPSGSTFNGWLTPQLWSVQEAAIYRKDMLVFDGTAHPLGVGMYSRSFQGELDWEDLKPHLVTSPGLPDAYVYHCMWQYRPWDADWALCVPYTVYKTLGPGRYSVILNTTYKPGEMLVATYDHRGQTDQLIIFNAHTCHPGMANDDFAGVAGLIRLFQWLQGRQTYYSYRLVLGPEHLGTVFYLSKLDSVEIEKMVCGVFLEMPGTHGPVKVASTFLGNQIIDRACHNVVRHQTKAYELVPWRKGAGNDETVWEAPGYEVPFVEVSRSEDLLNPYREYHTSLDTAALMDETQLGELLHVLQRLLEVVEHNARLYRRFNGIISLSNPEYDLYFERPDPAVTKNLAEDAEKWGYLLDCLLRYFDGSMTILDIAERHDLPFDRVYQYLQKFRDRGLVDFEFAPIPRVPISPARL